MKKTHLYDKNGYKSCVIKRVPKEFRRNRDFSTPNKYTGDIMDITCKICQLHIGKPYFPDPLALALGIAPLC